MEVNDIFTKILEFGNTNSKRDLLQEFCKIKIDLIVKYLPMRIINNDGGLLLDCIFNGLLDSPSNKYRIKVIDIVLQSMRTHSTSLAHCSNVISRLCLELPRMPANDLVRWTNDCVQSIVEDNDANMMWKDILPESLNALSSEITIKHCGTNLSYMEYKEQVVRTLCQCRWSEKQLVQLAAMFKDMQLSRNDHRQVVNKICSYIIDIPPDTLPPLVHQMLKLCKLHDMEVVLAHLSHYFSVRLYSKLEPPPQDSESTTMDIDDIVQYNSAELSRCLSNCLYHIAQGAAEPELIRKHVKLWPKSQLLRSPFLVDLALAISDKGTDFRTACLDVIRSAVEQRVVDELSAAQSSWVRAALPPAVDAAGVLKALVAESANHRQLTSTGLVHLGLALLGAGRARGAAAAAACWALGQLTLVRLCRAQRELAPYVLTQLADRLAGDNDQRQYAECLHLLCKLTPLAVERCTQLRTIIEGCQPRGGDHRPAAAVLAAVRPLLNYSVRTRDALIMVCRKGLYSRDSVHRCVALSGLLTVLRHLRLSGGAGGAGGAGGSQSACSDQFSAHSYLTQLTVDLHATQQGASVTSRVRNEAMCLEVVSIARRCLQQDAAVKQLLYSKIYECVRDKPMLHEAVLEMLYEHLSKYLPEGEGEGEGEGGAALLIESCAQPTATGAVLVEPIAHLLYAVALFVQPHDEEDLEDILASQGGETGSAYLKSKLASVLDRLCAADQLATVHMEEPGLGDLTPESKAKCLRVQQLLQCHEALVAHQLLQWAAGGGRADAVCRLHAAAHHLLEQTKSTPKSGKKGGKTLNETTEKTQKSQKSQKSQKEKGKAPLKLSNLTKDRAGPFKPLPCLWDFKMCLRMVELLYSDSVPWSSAEQRASLRARRDFHQWAVRCVRAALAAGPHDRPPLAAHVTPLANVLYRACLCKFQVMCAFDEQTALGCVELFKDCLALLLSPTYSLKIDEFFPKITGCEEGAAPSHIAAILERVHAALALLEEEGAAADEGGGAGGGAGGGRLAAALAQLAGLLLDVPVHSCAALTAVIIKLEDYVRKSRQECVPLIPALLGAVAREQHESPLLDDLLARLAVVLGQVDEEDTSSVEESGEFPCVEARTGHAVLGHVCAHLAARARCAELLEARARGLQLARAAAVPAHAARLEREVKEVYRCVVVQLCQLSAWTARLCRLRCAVGGGSDRVLAAAVRLYALLAALCRHLPHDLLPALRVERLLKLSGRKLSSVTDNLITYLEGAQRPRSAGRVLRDTKLIPRLVLEAEQFGRHATLLAAKTNQNFQQYLSLGTARDFRIRAPVLQEVLHARDPPHADDGDGDGHDDSRDDGDGRNDDEELDVHDADTDILSPAAPGSDRDERDDRDDRDDSDDEERANKRRRLS